MGWFRAPTYDVLMHACLDCDTLIERGARCVACQASKDQSAWQRRMCALIHRGERSEDAPDVSMPSV